MTNHSVEVYAQDKWQMGDNTTLSLGLRYDLELFPDVDPGDNPLFAPGEGTHVDANNFSPRIGFTRQLDDAGKSLVRAGYGIFYNRTLLGAIDDTLEFPKFTPSIVASFPNDSADPGPGRGQFPTDPFLVNGPVVNRALLDQLYPPGSMLRNTGVVIYDTPDRRQPYAHQMTVGYVRELASSLALHVDYVRIMNRDMFLSRNLLPQVRADTTRTGAITRVDAFGLFGADAVNYKQQVWAFENTGESTYDALNLQLEKRYANRWSGRVSYSLSKSRGTATDQADRNTDQFLTDLNLDKREGPTPGGSAAHPLGGQPRRGAQDLRHDPGGDHALHDRLAVHHLQQQRRRRSERPARRPGARRHLQRPRRQRAEGRRVRGRAQRRLRPRLLPARSAGRMAEADPGAHDSRRSSTSST